MRVLLSIILVATLLVGCTNAEPSAVCVPDDRSIARLWNEAALDAIRRDFPAPTVHDRNLFHLSTAMWDSWAAFDSEAVGYFTTTKEKLDRETAPPRIRQVIEVTNDQDRLVAISFAAHTV